MNTGHGFDGGRVALSALVVWAAVLIIVAAARQIGLCIVFRLTRRAIPGCVPAWSADRAPPAWVLTA